MRHNKQHYPNCLNCGHTLAEHYHFCPNCGQHPTDGKISFGHLTLEFFEDLLHLDGKLIATIRHVFIPGKLTEEFFKGRHKSYAAPLQLFLVLGGLFFLLISTKTHESEEKIQKKFEQKKSVYIMKQVLISEDSLIKTFPIYQERAAVKQFADSVLKKTYYKFNPKAALDIGKGYSESLKKLIKARLISNANLSQIQRDSVIKKLEKDSARFIENISDEKNITEQEAEKIAKQYADSVALLKEERATFINFNYDNDPKNILKPDSLSSFQGFATDKKEHKISEDDLYNLNEEQILIKYKVDGFWNRLAVRQTARFYKSGGDLIHYLLSKSLWFILASMLPIAFFLKLLYFRKHNFLIEHFLFLMHLMCFFFIISIIYLGLPMLEEKIFGESALHNNVFKFVSKAMDSIYYLAIPVGLWIAMKQFYKQSILKTTWKFFVLNIAAYTIGIIVIVIGLIISFAMF